jgi:hypothetical protein
MKRIYASLALLLAIGTGAFAQQRHCDVKVLPLVGPVDSFLYPCTGGVLSGYIMINQGPDTLRSTDTLMITDPNLDNTTVDPGSFAFYPAYPSGSIVTGGGDETLPLYDIAPGDTILNYQWTDSAVRLASLINGDTPLVYDQTLGDTVFNFVYTPYDTLPPQGHYYWMSRFVGFIDSANVTDDSPNNNASLSFITLSCVTGIHDLKYNNVSLTVYPNPTNDAINFNYTFTKSTNVTARVMDLTGRTFKTVNLGKSSPGNQRYQINVNELPTGMYLLEFTTDDSKGIAKFTKD